MLNWLKTALSRQPADSPPAPVLPDADLAALKLRQGNTLLDEGKLPEALERYKASVALHPSASGLVNIGFVLREMGRSLDAQQALQDAILIDPAQFDALYLLGTLAGEREDFTTAVARLSQALALQPDSEMVLRDLCLASAKAGEFDRAFETARTAVAAHPLNAQFHFLLGNILAQRQEPEPAIASFEKALAIEPRFPECQLNLGLALAGQGRGEAAVQSYRAALAERPDFVPALCALAAAQSDAGAYDEALETCRHAISLEPGNSEAHNTAGNLYQTLGRHEEAAAEYRVAISLDDKNAQAHNNLGLALMALGQHEASVQSIKRALELKPDYTKAYNNLGNSLQKLGLYEEAVAAYEQALKLDPQFVQAHCNFGVALSAQGNSELARERWLLTLALDPEYLDAWTGYLYALGYASDCPPQLYLAEARKYGAACLARATPYRNWEVALAPLSEGEPLKVGFLSGDLRSHPVGFFLEGIIRHVDPARIQFVAYSTNPVQDEVTARIKPYFADWQLVFQLSDEAIAARIHGDGVHMLIDLAGLTAHNRLPVLAWKPAPVQASWLGYYATTGVPGMDYFIADPTGVPPGHEANFSEAVRFMPHTRLCFTEPREGEAIKPNPLPALSRGYLTFGCFQNFVKINEEVLALWGRIFQTLPGARLRHQSKQMVDAAIRESLLQRLERHGIARDRVDLLPTSSRELYFKAHHDVDIMLDTFPYGGGTTTCESLWMGVPTITFAGETLLARQGASLLTSAGLQDWVAADPAGYQATLLAHCADLPKLAVLRAGLRERVVASPLFDGKLFAGQWQQLIRRLWDEKVSEGLTVPH